MSVSPVLLAALLERWRGCRSVAVVRPLASDLAAGRGSGGHLLSSVAAAPGAGVGAGSVLAGASGSIASGPASAVPSDALVALARSAS